MKTVTGREETISTNQLDFAVPKRMNLSYVGADNEEHMPYIIHRAPAGTHERFTAFLIEHFGGAFPTWLAPVQVKIICVSDTFLDYAKEINAELRRSFVRSEVDFSNDSLNKKIRTNTKAKIPNLIIIGENEVNDKTVTIRKFGVKEQVTIKKEEFVTQLIEKIKTRSLD